MIGSIFNTARNALLAHQTAVQVTSQNISNAHTEGYSRQRAHLAAATPARTAAGLLGAGVVVQDVTRTRDALLDATFRREAANSSHFGLRRELLGQVEEVFGELSEAGFTGLLDGFWSAWADLANHPANGSVRGLVRQSAQQLVFALHGFSVRLEAQHAHATARVERTVAEVNELARQLADVNRQIRVAESSGHSAPDLLDRRDRVLDELAGLAQIQVIHRADGSTAVYLGTVSLVDGVDARTLTLDPATQQPRVGTSYLSDLGGALGALLAVRDVEIPRVRQALDDFVRRLVEEVNAIHEPGTGRNFFDPAGLTAATIELSRDIDDPSVIGTVPGAPGDNTVALELAALRERRVSFPGTAMPKSLGSFYGDLITDIGLRVNSADRSAQVYEALASQADVRRTSLSGVSTDEELIHLMRHQQAYAAATRLVATADEMVQAILNMV